MKIGNIFIEGNIFLAPMAGVTDKVFRLLCREQGADLTYTEMVSAKGLIYGSENTRLLLSRAEDETPFCVQLFGSEPEIMAEAAKRLEGEGVSLIDINMGCPAPKIVKNGEGSALMNKPLLAGKIIKACSEAVKIPVTVKIRKGAATPNAVEIAQICQENGAAAITVHGRTREEYYSGKADLDIIKRVKQTVSIPVIGNGDITDGAAAENMFVKTGCDGVMIGRAAMGNPFIFREIKAYLKTGAPAAAPSAEERFQTALRHTKLLIELKGEYTALREMRTHLCHYIKGAKGAAAARTQINRAESVKDITDILKAVFDI